LQEYVFSMAPTFFPAIAIAIAIAIAEEAADASSAPF
jgi:hypothetical protein